MSKNTRYDAIIGSARSVGAPNPNEYLLSGNNHAAQMSRAKASQTKAGQRQERQSLNLIGLSTAILSTVAAIAAMQGGYFANSAMLF
ncbi:MAG: hypothetical protein V7L11_07400 [Nostoc sp.]|uniref:hypothetical protein n=1 Tax=Nostoc sp. TaxID=1180 RepID=UPI002FF5597F